MLDLSNIFNKDIKKKVGNVGIYKLQEYGKQFG